MTGLQVALLLAFIVASSATVLVSLDADVLDDSGAASTAPSPEAGGGALGRPPIWEGVPLGEPWDDEHFIQCQWDWACAAVAWACGAAFKEAPILRVCSDHEYQLAREDGRLPPRPPRTIRPAQTAVPGAPRAYLRNAFEIGFCHPRTGRVFLQPVGLQDCIQTNPSGVCVNLNVMRLILVHEATHAFDFQCHHHLFADDRSLDGEVRGVLREGHAWQVTELVSRAHGWAADYESFVHLVLGTGDVVPGSAETADLLWATATTEAAGNHLRYAMGRRLFRAAETRGGPSVIEDLLAHPPPGAVRGWESWQRWLRTRLRRHREAAEFGP